VPGPAYRIVTERFVVRCWEPDDAALLKEAVDSSLDHLLPWMPWAADEPQTLEEKVSLLRHFRASFDEGEDFVYGILDAREDRVLGGSGLHPRSGKDMREIGYWVRVDAEGQGVIAETTAALTRVAFQLDGVDRVEIHCDPANRRSAAVAERAGFQHEATLRRRLIYPNGRRDVMIWTMFADEYPRSPCAGAVLEAFDVQGERLL
jgi:RimJ/RimL family protein N-acetyltransferase